MLGRLHKLALAGFAAVVLVAPLASSASAEQRNGRTLPSRQMMRSHAMQHPMRYGHPMRYRHHMMRRHHMMHRRAM